MGENVRFIIPSSELKKAGNLIQVTLGYKSTDWSFDKLYIGHPAAAGDVYDFDGAQREVTFGGLSGGTVTIGGLTSDWIPFIVDINDDLIMAFYFGSPSTTPVKLLTSNYDLYTKTGDDEAHVTDVSSYTQETEFYLRRFLKHIRSKQDETAYLRGQSDVNIGAQGALQILKNLSGQSDISVDVQGLLGADSFLSGQSAIVISAEGRLSALLSLASTSQIETSCSAMLRVLKNLSGQADIVVSATGVIRFFKYLVGSSDINVTVEGNLLRLRGLSSEVEITVSGESQMFRDLGLRGQSTIVTSAQGILILDRSIKGQCDIIVSASGLLTEKSKVGWLKDVNLGALNSVLSRT